MSADPIPDDVALAGKLAETLHLDVEERARIPRGGVRLSDVVAAVRKVLDAGHCFPRHRIPGEGYEGVVIEPRADGTVWTHERHEIGVSRFSPVRSQQAASLEEAVTEFLRATAGRNAGIDGIAIDWHA